MDKKKILIIGSIILIIVSIGVSIFLIFNKSEEEGFSIDGITLPVNKEILSDNLVGDLTITDVSLLTRNEISIFKAKVSNNTDNSIDIKDLSVVFYNGDNETRASALMDVTISAGRYVYINIESEVDLSNTTKIEYVLE